VIIRDIVERHRKERNEKSTFSTKKLSKELSSDLASASSSRP